MLIMFLYRTAKTMNSDHNDEILMRVRASCLKCCIKYNTVPLSTIKYNQERTEV